MTKQLIISKYCKIIDNMIFVNGKLVFSLKKNIQFSTFVKAAYRYNNMTYPKFFKMDNLSKLGLITAEFLSDEFKTKNVLGEEIGIILSNSTSSLDTDNNYQKTISNNSDYFPSPSLFVYTLPNIVTGEICIKHKILGENVFFVSKSFDAGYIHTLVSDLILNQGIKIVLAGWVEYLDNEYVSSLCIVKNISEKAEITKEIINFTIENLKKIITG